jgi:pimeloyl-ACP methyl ester carboxylesterase
VAQLATLGWGRREDEERPLAVLVHGVTSHAQSWWRVGPALAERGWEVLAVDLRGHGSSPGAANGAWLGLEDLADDVVETVGGMVGDRKVDLLMGHSLGALTVLTLLAKRPGFARFAVLEDPPDPEADLEAIAADALRTGARARADPEGMLAELAEPPYSLDADEAQLKLKAFADMDAELIASSMRDGMRGGFDTVGLARGLKVPTLLFLASQSKGSALRGQWREQVATGLAHGWTEVVDAGHTIHREAYDSFMRRLDAWLERVGAGLLRP